MKKGDLVRFTKREIVLRGRVFESRDSGLRVELDRFSPEVDWLLDAGFSAVIEEES